MIRNGSGNVFDYCVDLLRISDSNGSFMHDDAATSDSISSCALDIPSGTELFAGIYFIIKNIKE